jgi:hypothetical protein
MRPSRPWNGWREQFRRLFIRCAYWSTITIRTSRSLNMKTSHLGSSSRKSHGNNKCGHPCIIWGGNLHNFFECFRFRTYPGNAHTGRVTRCSCHGLSSQGPRAGGRVDRRVTVLEPLNFRVHGKYKFRIEFKLPSRCPRAWITVTVTGMSDDHVRLGDGHGQLDSEAFERYAM